MGLRALLDMSPQVYSNGLSEIITGKAIKKLKLPRDEIVVMTKVLTPLPPVAVKLMIMKVYNVVAHDHGTNLIAGLAGKNPDNYGFVNQHGLSRKVCRDNSPSRNQLMVSA